MTIDQLMLDANTIFIVGLLLILVECAIAFFIRHNHQDISGIKEITGCYLIMPFGYVIIIFFRNFPGILIGNAILNTSLALFGVGLARFLEAPHSRPNIVKITLGASLIYWGLCLTIAPDAIIIRIHAFTILTLCINAWMIHTIIISTKISRMIKVSMAGIIAAESIAHVIRSILSQFQSPELLAKTPTPAWFNLGNNIYANIMFLLVLSLMIKKAYSTTAAVPQVDDAGAKTAEPSNETWLLSATRWELTTPGGLSLSLTAAEYGLLEVFSNVTSGTTLSRDEIYTNLPKNILSSPSNLDALIRRIRKKILEKTGETIPIKTAYGVGYVYTAPIQSKS